MKKFEYITLVEKAFYGAPIERLNDYGNEGWELISVIYTNGHYEMFFKREIVS